jgi:AcrR family transcriptional regulator
MYRHFTSKDDVLRAVVDQGLAGFAAMGEAAAVGRDRPLAERLTILGRAFLQVLDAQVDLLVLFAAEHQLLAGDARLVGFIDLAAGGLGAELAARARDGEVRDDLDGYLFARSFMGSLVSFVLLQRALGMDRVHPVEAEDYLAAQVDLYVRGAQP